MTTEDPIGAGLNGPADRSAGGTADDASGGVPAGPEAAGTLSLAPDLLRAGAADTVLALGRRLARGILAWAARRSLAPTSLSGIGLILGICAAAWFTAGTGPDNVGGSIAVGCAYLAARFARQLAGQPGGRLARAAPAARPAGLAAGRAGWLATLSTRATECAVYAGLAVGGAAQGGTGMWRLAITVISLVAVRETMSACGAFAGPGADPGAGLGAGPGRPAEPAAGQLAGHPTDHQAGRPASDPADHGAGRPAAYPAGRSAARAAVIATSMPFGGRLLLVAVAAPLWGARRTLVGLVGWAIIAIVSGIASGLVIRTLERRSGPSRPPRLRRRAGTEPVGLAVLLSPPRPAESPGVPPPRPSGQPIPVLRLNLAPPPGTIRQAAAGPRDSRRAEEDFPGGEDQDEECAEGGSDDPGAGYLEGSDLEAGGAGPGGADPGSAGPAGADPDGAGPGGAGPDGEADERLAVVRRCRDDGLIARWLGALAGGQLPPLPPALLALAGISLLAHLGLRDLPGLLILAPPIVMLLAAPGSSHRHDGRLDWLAPAVPLGAQCVYFYALGSAARVPAAATFALCAAVALRYGDLAASRPAPLAPGRAPWLGWEGRMIICGLGAAMGIATFAYVALAAYLGVLVCWQVLTSSLVLREG